MTNIAGDDFGQRRHTKGAERFEEAARSSGDLRGKVGLYRKAAEAYEELGSYGEAYRCLRLMGDLCEGEEKAGYLVSGWKTCIKAIAVHKYDAGFEWKGEEENLDPNYFETIEKYYRMAVDALEEAFRIQGISKDWLLDVLRVECDKTRDEGGWATSECHSSIDEALREYSKSDKRNNGSRIRDDPR